MKNKAFTLVELLGVIVLLGILGVVIIPKVGDSISNSREKAYETQLASIKKGVIDFLAENTEVLETNNTITIKLGTLKQGGYLPVNIKNPKTRKNFSNESLITITKTGEKYDISLSMQDLQNVTENVNENSPILVLNGSYVEYVEVNSEYNDLGAIAYSSEGDTITVSNPTIKLNDQVISQVDTSNLNTYSIVYEVTDSNNLTTSATRTVIVRDSTPPTITLPKDTNLHVSEVEAFDRTKGVAITDNYDANLTIEVNSSLANLPGNYVMTYKVTDSSGNQTTERRVINVNDDWSKYYTNVEYIESTGTQYINLGYKAKTNTEVRLDIQLEENQNTNVKSDSIIQKIIGSSAYNSNNFDLNFGKEVNQSKTIFYWVNKINNGTNSRYENYTNVTNRSTMTVKSGSATFQGITTTLDVKENDNDVDMILLGSGNGGTLYSFNRYDAKIYGLQIYEGTTLVKNMIPCIRKNDNRTGLYDLINNKFFTNSGTENFDYKLSKEDPFERKYTKVEFIGTNGTQYINLDYTAKTNTEIRLDIQFVNNDNTSTNDSSLNNKIIGQAAYTGEQFNINISSSNNKQIIYWVNKVYDGTNSRYQTYTNMTNRSTMIVKSGQAAFQGLTTTLDTKESDNTSNMLLLGNSVTRPFNKYDTKIYGFQIYEGDVLLKNMIPAIRNSDGKAGLYDIINDVFYTNHGTGEFIKGNPIN